MKVFHNRQVRHRALLPPITHAQYKVVLSAEMAARFSFSSRPGGQHTASGGQANSSLLVDSTQRAEGKRTAPYSRTAHSERRASEQLPTRGQHTASGGQANSSLLVDSTQRAEGKRTAPYSWTAHSERRASEQLPTRGQHTASGGQANSSLLVDSTQRAEGKRTAPYSRTAHSERRASEQLPTRVASQLCPLSEGTGQSSPGATADTGSVVRTNRRWFHCEDEQTMVPL